jgi:sirohydrochlorin cobaltochelatase
MSPFRPLALRLAVAACLVPFLAHAQPRVGTVIIAHGGGPEWNAPIVELAKSVQTGGPVEVSFLMGAGAATNRFQEAVGRLERAGVSEIVVVPLLVSSHSGHYDQIRWLAGDSVVLSETMHHHLHMAGITRPKTNLRIRVTKAIDGSTDIARVVAERAKALAPAPHERALLIVGHGPNSAEDNAAWMENLRAIADSVRRWTGFADVKVGLVRDDAPAPVRAEAVRHVRDLIDLQARLTGKDVIVVPMLISKGSVSRDKIPADLAGVPHVYGKETIVPHPAVARWVEARVRETIATTTK